MHIKRLLSLFMRRAKFKATGRNFVLARQETLERWRHLLPLEFQDASPKRKRNPYVHMLHGQLAHMKAAASPRPRHLLLPNRGLAYIRIPRAGSTAILRKLLHTRYPSIAQHQLSDAEVNYISDTLMQASGSDTPPHTTFFTVVRHPLARLASVYRTFFEGDTYDFLYEDYLFGILRKRDTFADFVRNIASIPRPLMDQHFRPQVELLEWYRRKNIGVKVLKVEEPEAVHAFLEPYDLEWTVKAVGDYSDYYDKATEAIARRIYCSDLNAFDYTNARF